MTACPFSGRPWPPDPSPLLADENGTPADAVAAAHAFLARRTGSPGDVARRLRRETRAATA